MRAIEDNISEKVDRDRVETVFPELALIRDEVLRKKVATVWWRTWHMSSYGDIHEALFVPHLPNRSLVKHTRGVTLIAIGIAKVASELHGVAIDLDRLIAAALLHDAAKCVELERKPDGGYGRSEFGKNYEHSYLVCEIGRQIGIPDDILHLVAQHSPYAPVVTRYVEGAILRYADHADADCVQFTEGYLSHWVKKDLPGYLYDDIFEAR